MHSNERLLRVLALGLPRSAPVPPPKPVPPELLLSSPIDVTDGTVDLRTLLRDYRRLYLDWFNALTGLGAPLPDAPEVEQRLAALSRELEERGVELATSFRAFPQYRTVLSEAKAPAQAKSV